MTPHCLIGERLGNLGEQMEGTYHSSAPKDSMAFSKIIGVTGTLLFVSFVYYVCKLCKAVRHKVIHCSSVYNTENLTSISGY